MDKSFICEVCNSTVKDAIKNQQGGLVCPICGYSASNLTALKPIGGKEKNATRPIREVH